MTQKLWAMMYDIGPTPPDNPDRAGIRRYELDISVKDPIIHGCEKLHEIQTSNHRDEQLLRVGYKELPEGVTLDDYAERLISQYGGEIIIGTEDLPHLRSVLFKTHQRSDARKLLEQEKYTLD